MKKALLIVDIQNDYFDGGANPLENSYNASLKAKEILNYFRNNNLSVIHIQHIAHRPGSTFFLPNTDGALIHNSVQPIESEKVIVKHYPNSFRDTELHYFLKSNEITDLVICGMMTHFCIDSTVRAAKDLGFNCEVICDACATKNLEIKGNVIPAREVHLSFLAALNNYYAKVLMAQEFIEGNK